MFRQVPCLASHPPGAHVNLTTAVMLFCMAAGYAETVLIINLHLLLLEQNASKLLLVPYPLPATRLGQTQQYIASS